jgi:cytochrome c553
MTADDGASYPKSRSSRSPIVAVALVALLVSPVPARVSAQSDAQATPGEVIYRSGTLPDGSPLHGRREALAPLDGAEAACVRCHRRSGIGSSEGQYGIPPITPRFLAQPREESRIGTDTAIAPGYHVGRPAYTDETLALAIREGRVPGGGQLGELMPRYALDDAAMRALLEHLKSLDDGPVPGIAPDAVHFAVIVTPDADRASRAAMLDVLTHYAEAPNPAFGAPRKMLHPNRLVGYRSGSRRWVLHVWDLSGAPATWERQLRERLSAEPVFAALSGLGGRDWAPVHRFCEAARLPCLLPNVDLPVVAEGDFYSVYFSRGVLLEAALAARWLRPTPAGCRRPRVVQWYRPDDVGAAAAAATRDALSGTACPTVDRPLPPGTAVPDWGPLLQDLRPDDAIVLWLRAADLRALPEALPPAGAVVASGLLAGFSPSPVPPAWRRGLRMTFNALMPEEASERTAMPRAWFRERSVALVDERIQLDTYVACAAMSDVLGSLFDSPSRELLVERFEDMLGTSTNPARYPRLGLAQGQRFASKGGYVVDFGDAPETPPAAEGGWTVP